MPSSLACWMVLVVVYRCSQRVYAVSVQVSPTVVSDPNDAKVILPCDYVLENPNQKNSVKWYKGREGIMEKDSSGKVIYGDTYRDRVRWGEGCSLILLNPGVSDSDRYTVKVIAPDDMNSSESAHTELIVTSAKTRETTTAFQQKTSATESKTASPVSKSTESNTGPRASQSTESNTAPPEDGYISKHSDCLLTLPVINIGVMALVFDVFLVCCLHRHGHSVPSIWYRLLLGSLVVIACAAGVITAVVGMAFKNTIILLVGVYSVCLGVAIHMTKCIHLKESRERIQDLISTPSRGPSLANTDKGTSQDNGENLWQRSTRENKIHDGERKTRQENEAKLLR